MRAACVMTNLEDFRHLEARRFAAPELPVPFSVSSTEFAWVSVRKFYPAELRRAFASRLSKNPSAKPEVPSKELDQ